MPFFTYTGTSLAALANNNMFASIVPAAAVNAHLVSITLGITTAGGAISDFDVVVGMNYYSARGTSSATATAARVDPNSGGSQITAVDSACSVQPTLAAADARSFPFNSRGGFAKTYNLWDILTPVGAATGITFVNRSGGALPGSHQIVWELQTFE